MSGHAKLTQTPSDPYNPLVRDLQKLGQDGFSRLIRGMLHTLSKSTKNETVFAHALFETGTFLNQPMEEIVAQGKFGFVTTTYTLVANKFHVRPLIKALALSGNTHVIDLIRRELDKKVQRDATRTPISEGAPPIIVIDETDDPVPQGVQGKPHAQLGYTYSCPTEGTEAEPLLPQGPPTRPLWEKWGIVLFGIIVLAAIATFGGILIFSTTQSLQEVTTTEMADY